MDVELKEIKGKLKKYGQEHLLMKYDELDEEGKEKLVAQIESIDFDLMKTLYEQAKNPVDVEKNVTIEPIEHVDKSKLTVSEKEVYEKKGMWEKGEEDLIIDESMVEQLEKKMLREAEEKANGTYSIGFV